MLTPLLSVICIKNLKARTMLVTNGEIKRMPNVSLFLSKNSNVNNGFLINRSVTCFSRSDRNMCRNMSVFLSL